MRLKDQGWVAGIVVPESDFIGSLRQAQNTNMIISLIILIFGVLLVSKFVESIINPLKLLIKETVKIKNFDLESSLTIKSRIKEVIQLSDAIKTMKHGLKAFEYYVPSKLVRQLIKTGENSKLGGDKKLIVSLFSDIKDFTMIANQADPNQLVKQLNEYFEVITNFITEEGGTIDKYIGDSIMAFWGAPEEIDEPCHHAARVALKFIEELKLRNQQWIIEGQSAFHTRIGIHIGEAIVGNIGSSERINYTAIGDSINIASRLEGLNKAFNTSVLVSANVYELIKHQFELREVGFVSLKGIAKKVKVYELLSYRGIQSSN
jgi:adenylate cyclase